MDVERLISTWRGPLMGLLAGWGASWPDAAELAQDTLVEAYLARERLKGDPGDPTVVGPWLRGIARHLYSARRRQVARRREEPLQDVHATAGDEPEDARAQGLRRAMASLPRKHRLVLYLHYLEDSGVREVAALLGVSASTVEGRLYQARRALRSLIADDRVLQRKEDER